MKQKIINYILEHPIVKWNLTIIGAGLMFVILVKLPYLVDVAMGVESFSGFLKNVVLIIIECAVLILPAIIYEFSMDLGRMKNYSKIDFINDKIIYRDIIYKYSVAGLHYLDGFKNNAYSNITILLLSLKLKNRIDFVDNRIVILNNEIRNLNESEIFILDNIVDGKVRVKEDGMINSFGIKEGIKDGLLLERKVKNYKKPNKRNYILFYIISNLLLIALPLFLLYRGVDLLWIPKGYYGIMGILLLIITQIVYYIKDISGEFYQELPQRTKLGEEINYKLEGLKNYIKKYSLLSEREKEELELWDEYLIYSVMFGQNIKIIGDMRKFIEMSF